MAELVYLTPGPTQEHPNLWNYMDDARKSRVAAISHRSAEFKDIYKRVKNGLEQLLEIPPGFHVFFFGSATEAMERIIENTVAGQSYHFVNGEFSSKMLKFARKLGKSPQKLEAPYGQGFSFESLSIPQGTELFAVVENETTTGVRNNLRPIYAIKDSGSLLAGDIVSSFPYSHLDWSQVDMAYFSVQKGCHLPAGLGVLILNDRAIAKATALSKDFNIGTYHSFPSLSAKEKDLQNPETPNVLGIYLLSRVLEDYNLAGIDKIRRQTEEKAQMLYDFFDRHPEYTPFVQDKSARSNTVVVVNTPNGSKPVMDELSENGIEVGSGYGDSKTTQIRIANFPMHRMETMEQLIRVLGR